ncbi:MAG: transcription termination/antitermination protein NusG [Candidatus Thermofonsia Clade 1 bacterium]|jgi:transcriptional antiterminator NusG|uniref:Transcription termination/antitermination protein NusG n=1 Tax=Candidatus Thermofonsia Clade 1 bacterium TaxID=2364210 RepID=A0A2M8PX68_9CHLR|nr:MAG: transcription termination/antitermination protein NusG [Candidatus Thermofonsia Clade 1 bacterium]PJF42154.1 MAG: transcription termination/antitermination protein NusG [Candidatus Thermofonsia Clade 1 bacterium]
MPPRRPRPRYEDPEYDPTPIYLDQIEAEEARSAKTPKKPKRPTTRRKKKDELIEEPEAPDHVVIGTNAEGEQIIIHEDETPQWYVVHCYSGYENKVRQIIEQRRETLGLQDRIFDIIVPTEEEIEVREGKRRTVERRVFPGYILVEMKMDKESWFMVRNTPGVTGFVGTDNRPTPLRPEEVAQIIRRMESDTPRIRVDFKIGDRVRIIDGPFYDFIGTVNFIDPEKNKVRVMVSFFGRETPVELDFLQVEKAPEKAKETEKFERFEKTEVERREKTEKTERREKLGQKK